MPAMMLRLLELTERFADSRLLSPFLSRLHGDRHDATHCRSDGVLVRYVPISGCTELMLFRKLGHLLDRVASGPAELSAVDQLDSMKRLVENAFAANGRLSQAGFFFEADCLAGPWRLLYATTAVRAGKV